MRGWLLLASLALLLTAQPLLAEEEPVTRADAQAWLRAVETSYAREDLGTLLSLTANEVLERQVGINVGRLFKDRNYFKLSTRVLDFAPRTDGTAELEFIEVMLSRPKEARSDLREKTRRRVRLQRREGRVVVIDSLETDSPQLPASGQWSPEHWSGRVELSPRPAVPFGSPEGEAKVSVRLRLRNLSPTDAQQVAFGLHPFVTELSMKLAEGSELEVLRHEGTADAWSLALPQAVAPGQAVELEIDYALIEVGIGSHSRIGSEGAHLFPESAWLPTFAPTPVPGADRASHDVTVVVPKGWTGVAPGELVADEILADGRRAMRWQSRFPGEAVVVVAGALERADIRLSDHLTAEAWTQPGAGGVPPKLAAALESMTAHFERILGPAPVERFALVHALAPGRRAQPAFFVIDDPGLMEADLFERRRERQPLFYLAHQLTHLWLQDGVRPIGGPAQILTEGLCDHLAFDWFDASVDDRVSLWHRDRILHMTRSKPAADRPLLVTHPGAPDHDVFGAGKALVVLDGFRAFAGADRWQGLLRDYVQEQRGKQVGVGELLAAFGAGDARLEAYVNAWIVGEGLADIAVHEPVTREVIDPASGERSYEIEVTVENLGLGPVPVALRTLEDAYGSPWREQQLELGSLESTVLRFELANPLRMVEADQRLLTWQSAVKNDTFPERKRKPKSFKGQKREVSERDQQRLEELLKN
jgi:hypothetical protein